MTARPIKAIDELNGGSLLDTKQNRNFTHTERLKSRKQERDECQLQLLMLMEAPFLLLQLSN